MSTQAGNTTVETAINPDLQLRKFSDSFALQGEIVGQSIRKRVSTKGAVRVDVMTRKDVGAALNIKGDALDVHMRTATNQLKAEMMAGMSRLAANADWTGRAITMNAKGDVITFALKKVKPLQLSAPTPKPTAAEAIKLLGIDPAKQEEAIKALQELGFMAPPAAPAQPQDVSGTGAGEAASNGAATVQPEAGEVAE